MAGALSRERTWAGFVFKSSGDLVAIGYESHTGVMWRLDDPVHNVLTFTCKNFRLGAGLGGNFGLGLIIFFNCRYNLGYIEQQSLGHGWGFSVDIPVASVQKYTKLIKDLKDMKEYYEIITKIQDLTAVVADIWAAEERPGNNPIIHVAFERSIGLSAGVMRSFGGKIDIRALYGRNGYIENF